jgi:hypothetical protein
VLLNTSTIPATISYFDLAWVKRRTLFACPIPFTSEVVKDDSPVPPEFGYDETIPPHGTHHLNFTEDYHFDWGGDLKENIYLRLWLVGRRSPIWLLVAGPKRKLM